MLRCVPLLLAVLSSAVAVAGPESSELYRHTETRVFDGTESLRVAPGIRSARGFAIDVEILFDDVTAEHRVFEQPGLLLLRMDAPAEGGRLSFFVNIGAQLEPRLYSIEIEPQTWYRVTASWDGSRMWMRVNDRTFRALRTGSPARLDAALEVGGSASFEGARFRGKMKNLRIWSSPLTEVETLLTRRGSHASATRGWFGVGARITTSEEDALVRARIDAPMGVMATASLPADLPDSDVLTLRLAATGGESMKLYAETTAGKREVTVPLIGDGRSHSYAVAMADFPEWRSDLKRLALAFSRDTEEVTLESLQAADDAAGPPEGTVELCYADPPYLRAGRPFTIVARFRNTAGPGGPFSAVLGLPDGVRSLDGTRRDLGRLGYRDTAEAVYRVEADTPLHGVATIALSAHAMTPTTAATRLDVHRARPIVETDAVPAPRPIATKRLVGAHYCPLWKQGARSGGWELIEPFPKREPVLGWYDEHDPDVTDWEIKWALEHGIDFFVYCWYRGSQEGPVRPFLGHALHEGLFHSRYGDRFHFAIMWENQLKGRWGVRSKRDLLENLLPFWLENYFRRPNYLVIDDKPVLFIYQAHRVVEDLGSEAAVRGAFAAMREACVEAGFSGLYILAEDRSTRAANLKRLARLGMDASFSYCWPIANDPDDETAIAAQEDYWRARRDLAVLPDIVTVSMGWDATPWHPSQSKWRLTPQGFETACRKADSFLDTLPAESLGSKMILLDNWNEFGEGHYIFPHREHGFGYLDAVRAAFAATTERHEDVVPEDIGLGPYEELFEAKKRRDAQTRQRRLAPGGDAEGLVAWWTFDEADGSDLAWDYSGHRLGGRLQQASRVQGRHGKALVCDGGSIRVAPDPLLAPRKGITVTAWIKTEIPDQVDRWFLNRIHGGRDNAGYRFGLEHGRLSWAVPQTRWSHHLRAREPLPLGRWVHVAATCDRRTIKVYMDGRLAGTMERFGAVKDNQQPLVIGSYDVGHRAFFRGLLDDLRIYDYAMDAESIRRVARDGY